MHYNWHHHAEYELIVCRNGTGEAHVGAVIYSFKGPAAFFIAPAENHALISAKTFDGWIIQIPPLIMDSYGGRPEFQFLTDLVRRTSPALCFSVSASSTMVRILEKAQERSGIFRWIPLVEALYLASQDREARAFSFKYTSRDAGKDDGLDEIINRLFNDFAEEHRLSDLAAAAGMPVQRFCRQFKKRTSMSVIEYLHSVRINIAKKLLQQSKLYIDDIGYEIGFNSVSFFNRKFKEHTGMTPGEYRRHFGGSADQPAGEA
jgi:transcriptional regulator GlxA family with amidase domain